jgi:Mrp family chromosome partitioning ATPase
MAREELFPTLRAEYDLIVLDTPPVLVVDDACRIGPLADGVLIVVRWGRSASEELREAADRLRRSGAEVTGTIFNDVNPGVQSRYYGAGGYIGGKMASRYHNADA